MTDTVTLAAVALHYEDERRKAARWVGYRGAVWIDTIQAVRDGWCEVARAVLSGQDATPSGRRVPSWAPEVVAEVTA